MAAAAAPNNFIDRVNVPLIRPLVATAFPVGLNVAGQNALRDAADDRREWNFAAGAKIIASAPKALFSLLPIQNVITARITATGDHFQATYLMQASLRHACEQWRMMLSSHGIDILMGTNAVPNFAFAVNNRLQTTLEHQIKIVPLKR